MISVITDVLVTFLEGIYLLFLLDKEEVRSRAAEAFLFICLAVFVAFASYLGMPLMQKYFMQVCIIIFIGCLAYASGIVKMGFYAVSHILLMCMSEFLVMGAWGFFDRPVLSVNLAYEDFRISLVIVSKAFHFWAVSIFRHFIYQDNENLNRYELFPIILSGISFITVFVVININIAHIPDRGDKALILAGDAAVLAAFILNIIFAERYVKVKKLAEEEKQKFMQMELQYQYYERKKEDMQYIRQIYHDMKNHLLLLGNEKISDQIESRIKIVEDYYETGNEFLDVIISDKLKTASEKSIRLECDIDFTQGGFIQPLDISTIFGNLLDNAIEAAEKLDADEKYIFCRAGQKRSLMIVRIHNHYLPSQNRESRQKPYMHGFGLKNVQDAVRKYDGECCIEKEHDIFKVSIVFPMPGNETISGRNKYVS